MKARLITNGVLSIISSIIEIIWLVFFAVMIFKVPSIQTNHYSSSLLFIIISLLLLISWIPSFIMGVLTLSMEKDVRVIGLTISSGIISLFGGLFFINTIISFIAVYKINK